jgi:hypothetical protein
VVERPEAKIRGRKDAELRVEAVMPNGFDLANIHYGLIKRRFKANARLRSEKSKKKEMQELHDLRMGIRRR